MHLDSLKEDRGKDGSVQERASGQWLLRSRGLRGKGWQLEDYLRTAFWGDENEMVPPVRTLTVEASSPEFNSQIPRKGGRKEPAQQSDPLTSMRAVHVHPATHYASMCTHKITIIINKYNVSGLKLTRMVIEQNKLKMNCILQSEIMKYVNYISMCFFN